LLQPALRAGPIAITSGSLDGRTLRIAGDTGFKDCGLAMVFPGVPRRRHRGNDGQANIANISYQ
jgi:hypothetical protein